MNDPTLDLFKEAVTRPEEDIDLATAALVIAMEEYPDLQPRAYLDRLEEMAYKLRRGLPQSDDPRSTVAAINAFLFEKEGFRGNSSDYDNPKNSFLNEVLDRKLGVPLTLSLLYMEMGKRVGLPLSGVGLPGGFLVRPPASQGSWYIDPFNKGAIVGYEDCARNLNRAHRGQVDFRREFLTTVNKRQFLYRLLGNLKATYLDRNDLHRALPVIERMLILFPDGLRDLRDKGLALSQLGLYTQAVATLERYVALAPSADDAEATKDIIDAMWRVMAGLA